jgi:hypothetical protein
VVLFTLPSPISLFLHWALDQQLEHSMLLFSLLSAGHSIVKATPRPDSSKFCGVITPMSVLPHGAGQDRNRAEQRIVTVTLNGKYIRNAQYITSLYQYIT